MAVDTPPNDHREKKRDRRHARGNTLIAAGASVLSALVALGGTLATIYFSPRDVAEQFAPNAATTTTVTHTIRQTVTAPAPNPVTPEPGTGDSDHLAEMERTAAYGTARTGTFPINGTPFTQSVALGVSAPSYTSFREYTLDGTYRNFTATLGLNDELRTDASVEFVISGNGKVLHRQTVKYTQRADVSLDVTGLVKLRVEATRVTGRPDDHSAGAVYGSATLTR
ncbi:NPCBM/NEW2 domain-containing protein [Nonomuraea sp. NPDC048826]|uniref:NPCBM/NEW2 domain-containing protein n=1 Tax=Nonomuraea sp. NPDC048826 TaxID=3364347 RepID=UPI0037105269